jgi:hypothetical protein
LSRKTTILPIRDDMNAITLRRSLAASLLALAVGFAALFRP